MSSGDFRFVLQTRIFVGLIILDLFLKARIFVNSVQAARNWCNGFPQTNEVHFEKEQKPAREKISDLQKKFLNSGNFRKVCTFTQVTNIL